MNRISEKRRSTTPRFLSQEEREEGLKRFQKHSFWNGLGFNLLNVTVVYLMAIHFDATNLQLGYISAVFHVAGVVNLFLPYLIRGARITQVFFYGWLFRGLICLLYGLLFVLEGQAAVFCILFVYTSFSVLRIVGIAVQDPLYKNVLKPSEVGENLAKLNVRQGIAQAISKVISFVTLSVPFLQGIGGLVLLTYLGTATNTLAAVYIKNVPSRERVELRKGRNPLKVFIDAMGKREVRLTQMVRWLGLSAGVLLSLIIPFLRKEAGLPPNLVFLYMLVGAGSYILASLLLRPFADRVGSKPLVVASNFLLAIIALVWAFAGTRLPWIVYFILGFFTFFFMNVRMILVGRLLIKVIPERDRIGYTSMMNFGTAGIAFCAGMLGGFLLDIGGGLEVGFLHSYSLTFVLAALLIFFSGFFCLRLRDYGSLTFRETAEILFSIRNLRAFLDLYQLDTTDDPVKKETILRSLGLSDTRLAARGLQDSLKTPLSWEKERIFRSLFTHPKNDLLDDIIEEARDAGSYNRRDAIFTLGAYPGRRVRKILTEFLDEKDPEVVSIALKSLARIGDSRHLDRIWKDLKAGPVSAKVEMDYIIALSIMDKDADFLEEMFRLARPERGKRFQQLIYVICSRRLGLEPPVSEYFQLENDRRGRGFAELVGEARQLEEFQNAGKQMNEQYRHSRYSSIWSWCRDACGSRRFDPPWSKIAKAVENHDTRHIDDTNTLAATYFTYKVMSV